MAGFIEAINDNFTWLFTGKKPVREKKLPFDPTYFHKLCIAIRDSAPTYPKLNLTAQLAFDNTFTVCIVAAKTKNGNNPISISASAQESIRKALVDLRTHTIDIGGAHWIGLSLDLDVPKDSYQVNFDYPKP